MDEDKVTIEVGIQMHGPIIVTKITDVKVLQDYCKANYDGAAQAVKKLVKLRARMKVLRELLAESKREHGRDDEDDKTNYLDGEHACSCGADEWNARVDAVLGKVP